MENILLIQHIPFIIINTGYSCYLTAASHNQKRLFYWGHLSLHTLFFDMTYEEHRDWLIIWYVWCGFIYLFSIHSLWHKTFILRNIILYHLETLDFKIARYSTKTLSYICGRFWYCQWYFPIPNLTSVSLLLKIHVVTPPTTWENKRILKIWPPPAPTTPSPPPPPPTPPPLSLLREDVTEST